MICLSSIGVQNHDNTMNQARPPFIDSLTGICYEANNPDFEGWLTKESMWVKDWRRRYFLLKASRLFFARSPNAAPHGMVNLSQCTTVKSAGLKSRRAYSFEVTDMNATYLLYAESEKDKDDWIGQIGRAIVKESGTYQRENSKDLDDAEHNIDEDNGSIYSNDSDSPYFN